MLKAITIPMLIALAALSQLVHAEVVDESWRQVYDFQSKMAAQGSSKAQFTLGEMYENGRGVAKNYDTAIDWYNKAKSTGHADAEQRITMLNRAIEQQANDNEKAVAKRKADKEKAVAKRKAEKERAQQKAIEQKRAAEVKRKEQASEKKSVAKAKKAAKQKKSAQAKLSPEERAKKIKAAQERAKKIAQENEKKQQQEADAALEKYRSSMSAKASTDKDEPKAKIPEKYIDPFE